MNVSEITAQLYAISRALVEKTGENPWIPPAMKIEDNACSINLYKAYTHTGKYDLGNAKGETPEDAISAAFALIAAMPGLATAAVQRHMERVADCIDKGREDGIDDAYIAPLVVVKAAMTENLLTKGDAK